MVKVAGFGDLPDAVLSVRLIGQSYTCQEKKARLTVVADCGALAFVKLDKGFFPDGNECDYSISEIEGESAGGVNGILIELKGRHLEDAAEQFRRTLCQLKERSVSVAYLNVAIVSSGASIPGTKRQKLTLKIQRMGLSLHYVKAGERKAFSDLIRLPSKGKSRGCRSREQR